MCSQSGDADAYVKSSSGVLLEQIMSFLGGIMHIVIQAWNLAQL